MQSGKESRIMKTKQILETFRVPSNTNNYIIEVPKGEEEIESDDVKVTVLILKGRIVYSGAIWSDHGPRTQICYPKFHVPTEFL